MTLRRENATPPIICDRYDQANKGQKRYYTGRPCKRGHMVERFVSTGGCVDCTNPRILAPVHEGGEVLHLRLQMTRPLQGVERDEVQRLLQAWTDHIVREWTEAGLLKTKA